MLVLKRWIRQRVLVGDDVVVEVLRIGEGWVSLGITAPDETAVDREEVRVRRERDQEGAGE